MKQRRKNTRQATSRPQVLREPGPPLSRSRLWLFRIVALSLPLFGLLLVELGLRLAGYGHPTGFFKEREIGGQRYLINSEHSTLRFFPPELARWPTTFRFPVNKPAGVRRIFVFGESAAMGDPQPAYSASRYLEVLLRERFPGEKFEVINLGITAINSHVILPMARECARRGDGDIWIIYMGNNEMVGPFGAATVFGSRAPPRAAVRFNLAVQSTRTGQLLTSWLRNLGGRPKNTTWGGMRMFLENQIPPDDPRKETVYANFASNLRDIVSAGLDSGAQVILSTVSVNLRDCPPFASLANSNRPAADLEQFQKLYTNALALEAQGKDPEAAASFEEAARSSPTFAELRYRLAACQLRSGNPLARDNYQLACDLDALPFRADSRINEIIRRAGREFPPARLVLSDAESELGKACLQGVAGDEVFFEHVHFNFRGNYLLGRLWAEHIKQWLPDEVTATHAAPWASQETCDRNLGLTIWNRSFVIDSVIRRMRQPPLSSQFNNPARLAVLEAEAEHLTAQQADTNNVMRSGQSLVDAIQRAPEDTYLKEGFANLLEAVGDRRQAASAYQKMLEILPHDFYAKLQLGRLHGELGEPALGEPLLQQAGRERASVPDVWAELGNVQMARQKYADALESYSRGLKLRPQDPVYLCYQANALAKLGRRTEAMETYRRAIQMQADIAEAHFELAGLLAAENQVAEALREYAEAIRLNPRHAVSRINFGVILVRLGRLDEAIQQFEVALQLDPKNAAAANYLREVSERRNRGR